MIRKIILLGSYVQLKTHTRKYSLGRAASDHPRMRWAYVPPSVRRGALGGGGAARR
jgi:hypothetical protein